MDSTTLYDEAIYNVAYDCAYLRKTKICKERFSINCPSCKFNIHKYLNIVDGQADLFMYQVERDVVASMKEQKHYKRERIKSFFTIAIALAAVFGIFYFGYWALTVPKAAREAAYRASKVQPAAYNDIIAATCSLVAKYMYDVTGNGKANCEDAAILFYQYYPNKNEVWIYANDNPKTGMFHAFNLVLIDGVYRAIEPQAYIHGYKSYFMRDIWGSQYDASLNKDAWNDYGKFVN